MPLGSNLVGPVTSQSGNIIGMVNIIHGTVQELRVDLGEYTCLGCSSNMSGLNGHLLARGSVSHSGDLAINLQALLGVATLLQGLGRLGITLCLHVGHTVVMGGGGKL